jgi:hypothetical protein
MRYNSTVQVGGRTRTRHSTQYIQVDASPGKRKRDNRVPHPDYLLPDVAPDEPFDDFGMSLQDSVQTEEGFAFDEGHPVEPGPRETRDSVSFVPFILA